MREALGDIWELAAAGTVQPPVVCVTTNLQWNSQGRAIMGAGIAAECRYKFLGIDSEYGKLLRRGVLTAVYLGVWRDENGFPYRPIMFPTKDQWRNPSIISLIEQSSRDLVTLANTLDLPEVFLPRPGCGMGGLKWPEVKVILDPILDDRFVAVGFLGG